ncbi:MAG: class I SAM-dependent methyltransferase [Actinomycetota bacterium]
MSAAQPHDYDRIWRDAYGDMQEVGPVHRHMRRILRGFLRGLDYETALDVGCGAGHNMALLRQGRESTAVTGVDLSDEALERAGRSWPDAEFHRLDIQRERLDRSWDLVFSSLVLEHLPDDRAALGNMRSMAGKYVLVTTIAGDFERYRPWEEQMGHVRNYAAGELEAKMSDAGLRVERATYWGFPFYTPVARRLQNRMRSEPSYRRETRFLAQLMYGLYFLNSHRRGDLLVVLARA